MKVFEFSIAIEVEAETEEDAILELGVILYNAHDLENELNANQWEVEEITEPSIHDICDAYEDLEP